MGSPTDLTDLSDGSIYWLLFILLSNFIKSFRRFFCVLGRIDDTDGTGDAPSSSSSSLRCGSGPTAVEDQLSLNRRSSCLYSGYDCSEECVVCLCGLSKGELVRELDCRHVFHKGCLDGWLRRQNFTCPICRSPLLPIAAPAEVR